MVHTVNVSANGERTDDETERAPLPDLVHITAAEARRIPSPGAQRALKAETGRSYDELCGTDADSADRHQTMIWMKLRRQFPDVRWADCVEITIQVEEGALDVDPTKLAASASSPPSAGSGE